MATVTVTEAQAKLGELIETLAPGEELVITRDEKPVAKLTGVETSRPVYGRGKGKVIIHADDDSHLEDFAEYM